MKTFPITNQKYTSEIKSFYERRVLPIFDWGKKIYVLLNNELTACIPTCVCAARNPTTGDGVGAKFYILIGAKIAGREKDRILFSEDYYFRRRAGDDTTSGIRLRDLRFFETPEDYNKYIAGDNSAEMALPYVEMKDILTVDHGYKLGGSSDYVMPVQWAFDKDTGRPATVTAPIKALWLDDEGSHVELFDSKIKNGETIKFYPSEEACRKANTAKVVDFDDDDTDEETPKPLTEFEDRLAEVIYDAVGECDAKVMDMCCDYARKYSRELLRLAGK